MTQLDSSRERLKYLGLEELVGWESDEDDAGWVLVLQSLRCDQHEQAALLEIVVAHINSLVCHLPRQGSDRSSGTQKGRDSCKTWTPLRRTCRWMEGQ